MASLGRTDESSSRQRLPNASAIGAKRWPNSLTSSAKSLKSHSTRMRNNPSSRIIEQDIPRRRLAISIIGEEYDLRAISQPLATTRRRDQLVGPIVNPRGVHFEQADASMTRRIDGQFVLAQRNAFEVVEIE